MTTDKQLSIATPSDGELLRRYVDDGSEEAFTALVQRHINMVYLAALRRVGRNAHSADDVTQKVFADLARKAKSLKGRPSMAGWLYTATRFAAAEVVRAERRRHTHEQEAHTMHEPDFNSPAAGSILEPFLDEIMDLLPEQDREAVLLHFFEGHTFVEAGAILSLSADAVRMRVNRALERLRVGLAKQGVTSSSAVLADALIIQSTLAVPAPLALAVASHALSHANALHAGMSLAGRLIQAVKSSPLAPWVGAVVLIVVASLFIHTVHPANPAAASASKVNNGAAATDTAPPEPNANIPDSANEPFPDDAPSSTRQSGVSAEFHRPPIISDFGKLSAFEKNILKTLWAHEEHYEDPPDTRWGFSISENSPSFVDFGMSREILLSKGLIGIRPATGGVYLTNMGRAFCRTHGKEIDSYPLFYKKIGPAN